jgi:hypothetical protein
VKGRQPKAFAESLRSALDEAGWTGNQDVYSYEKPSSLVGLWLSADSPVPAHIHGLRRTLREAGFPVELMKAEAPNPRLVIGHTPEPGG